MKSPMSYYIRFIACLLSLTVSAACCATQASAMLIPAGVATTNKAPSPQRIEDMRKIERVLESKVLQDQLHKLGMSETEINYKLSRLSDNQVHQFASRVDKATSGGFPGLLIGLVVLGILVLLFIYILKVVIK